MDLERYYELRAILQQWRMRLAESIRRRIEDNDRWLNRLRAIYEGEGVGEEFTLWLDRWCRQAAIQFILRVLFLRVLEDRDLLGVTRIRNTDGQRMWAQLTRNLGAASYVQWCCWDAAHLLPDLFGPTDYDLVLPDDDLVQRFLNDVWRRPDPNRPGWLRFDFRHVLPSPAGGRGAGGEGGDEGFRTHFIGDLYQELDPEIRARYALLQTPHFISQFILEHTLLKRFEELALSPVEGKDFRQVTLIDPTCGSGHFLVDAFWMFVERYEVDEQRSKGAEGQGSDGAGERYAIRNTQHVSRFTPHASLSPTRRAKIARTIIENHLYGCDINPYATALARFRLALAACDYAQPTSLRDFRDLRLNLVTIDSLIPYEKLMVDSVQAGTATARVLGQPEAIQRALPVLRKRYDVVVGNPPYITTDDTTKRNLYREHYKSAYRSFGLSTPFTERFVVLSLPGARVGLINSNAFARRQFGAKLVENVLPNLDLETIVDLSGVFVPGHGTPTLVLVIRHARPKTDTLKLVSCLRGESSIPDIPAHGRVWQSIVQNFEQDSFEDENVIISSQPRTIFNKHPWNFDLAAMRVLSQIDKTGVKLVHLVEEIGSDCAPGMDEVYISTSDHVRRLAVDRNLVRLLAVGEDLRDWIELPQSGILFPYTRNLEVIELKHDQPLARFLQPFRVLLADRISWGKTMLQRGLEWYEFDRFFKSKHAGDQRICYSLIATHNHFVLETTKAVLKNSGMVVKLTSENASHYPALVAILNSSITCFFLKQVCFNKGLGEDPVRDRYVYDASYVGEIPMPITEWSEQLDRPSHLASELVKVADTQASLAMSKLFESVGEAYHAWNSALDGYVAPHPDLPPSFSTARELRAARDKLVALRQDIRGRMIFLQEEMDWLAYEMYGLLKSKAPLAEDYLSRTDYQAARLELGQRPFEIAGKGYKGDWPKGYQPAPLPETLRPLTEARIAVIEANPDIALLEDPLYKRRWIPPDYDKEFRQAAGWWLAEKLEWALEQHSKPISLRQWARSLGRDERVNAALEVLTGTPLFDLEEELLKVIRANAVPNRPEHYLKPSGLRKLYAARNPVLSKAEGTQHAIRNTPRFSRKDFSDSTAWKRRGKLNIPRERFIAYAEFDHTRRSSDAPETGGPWFGWAGWDAAQRADGLAFLLDRANRAGWELRWRQCGLRAALRDLLPQLADLPSADRAEFEAIAAMCGIGLGSACYCQAYRDSIARGEPGVPGVGAEVLGVKVLASEGKRSPRKPRSEDEQLGLDL